MFRRAKLIGVWLLACVVSTIGIAKEPQSLYLYTEYSPYVQSDDLVSNLLLRELARQAFVTTAREDWGIDVYDQTLGESLPNQDSKTGKLVKLALVERARKDGTWQLQLHAVSDDVSQPDFSALSQSEPLWKQSYTWSKDVASLYREMSQVFQTQAKSDFAAALRAAGFQIEEDAKEEVENNATNSTKLLDRLEEQLLAVDFIIQFGVVRAAHEEIQRSGMTPALLSVLVRGYANLSMLTQHQWNAAGDVFAARAILYSTRLNELADRNEVALWNEAYMWAVIGCHHHALEAVAKADEAAKSGSNGTYSRHDQWSRLIEPYCNDDQEALDALARDDRELEPWARRLDFQIASCYRYTKMMLDSSEKLFQVVPTAYGVYSDLTTHGQDLGATRLGAFTVVEMFSTYAPQSLRSIESLPVLAQNAVAFGDAGASIAQWMFGGKNGSKTFNTFTKNVSRELRKASQAEASPGLSWSALAFLLEEENFVEIANYMLETKNATENSVDDEIAEALSQVGDHRYANFLNSFKTGFSLDRDSDLAVLAKIQLTDVKAAMSKFAYQMWKANVDNKTFPMVEAWKGMYPNFTYQSIINYSCIRQTKWAPYRESSSAELADVLLAVAPNSEVAIRAQLTAKSGIPPEQLKEWTTRISKDPKSFEVLGRMLINSGQRQEGIAMYEQAIDFSTDFRTFMALADIYLAEADYEKWEFTYERLFETEDTGLSHASAHAHMAGGYLARGLWEEALPHANIAGQAYSAWGLSIAGFANEGLANWSQAERNYAAAAKGYSGTEAPVWYFYCRRTGRGDVESARILANTHFEHTDYESSRENEVRRGAFRLMDGRTRDAYRSFQKTIIRSTSFTCTFMNILLGKELGETKAVEKAIEKLEKHCAELPDKDAVNNVAGMKLFDFYKTQSITDEQLQEIEQLLLEVDPLTRSAFAYYLARQLEIVGKSDLADAYYRKAMRVLNGELVYASLSGFELSKKYEASRKDDEVYTADDLWPSLEWQKQAREKKKLEQQPQQLDDSVD